MMQYQVQANKTAFCVHRKNILCHNSSLEGEYTWNILAKTNGLFTYKILWKR